VAFGDGSAPVGAGRRESGAATDAVVRDEPELDHLTVRARLSDYLEQALEGDLRERVRRHLERCPSCRAVLSTLERTVELAGGLPAQRLPDQQKRRILDRLLTAAEPGPASRPATAPAQ
jgi:anti-sigma factor RsiW